MFLNFRNKYLQQNNRKIKIRSPYLYKSYKQINLCKKPIKKMKKSMKNRKINIIKESNSKIFILNKNRKNNKYRKINKNNKTNKWIKKQTNKENKIRIYNRKKMKI